MKLLVVAAWEPELSPLRRLCVDLPTGLSVVMTPIGTGIVDAAVGACRALLAHTPTHALFVGTCGRLFARAEPMPARSEVVVGEKVRLVDPALLQGRSATPPSMPTEVFLDPDLRDAAVFAGAKCVQIANTVGITTDDRLAAEIEAHADVEHLEAFAFARACALSSVPCGVVLGVANAVGSMGREQWRARHEEASERAAEVVDRALRDYFRTTTRARSPERA